MASKATRPAASNEEIVQKLWNTLNTGDYSVVDEIIAESYVEHNPTEPESIHGREGFTKNVKQYREAFSDLNVTIEDIVSEGDMVATRWKAVGTHDGELAGVPASGNHVEVTGIEIDRIVDGQVTEVWTNFDVLGMMRQMGAIPDETGS
ncbi:MULTISPECIES: ester cyclase [unclassified Haladaptatus]|uniref:ester cyclase n=1 Tax=unclassified Haladaptatus TaxID=2622732 RepID=UPI0023E76163|nr:MULTISPECIES: ester cyclase [unclassified Haladaptatus]